LVQRSWVWGPATGDPFLELYASAPGGRRVVQYFDKGRMEVNDPYAPLSSEWYVSGGRLAWELITGQHQIGDYLFESRSSADVPLAGDPTSQSPTYTTLKGLLAAAPIPAGWLATQRLGGDGRPTDDRQTASYGVTVGAPLRETGHSVASVFQSFLAQNGPNYVDGQVRDGPLFAPPFALTGLPITEPYWVQVPVAGVTHDVLVQCFERRCLTYTPTNSPDWQVEMGNIGQHYQRWLQQSRPIVWKTTIRDW
jgi:hypothetical protein